MQSYELEFVVSTSLDGVTPSPVFIPINRAPSSPDIDPESLATDVKEPDEDNIYRFDVTNLGVIDPDFGVGGSFGDRFIVGLWIDAPNAGDANALVAVFTSRPEGREVVQKLVVPSLAGQTSFYLEDCIFIPQGSLLGLIGFLADPATESPIIVRLHVKQAETLEEYALLLDSCCCQSPGCLTPTVDLITPATVTCDGSDPSIDIFGANFTPETTVVFEDTCLGSARASAGTVSFIDSTHIHVDVICDGECSVNVRVSNGLGCDVLVEDAFDTTSQN